MKFHKDLIKSLKLKFRIKYELKNNFLFVQIRRKDYVDIAKFLKKKGFKRMLTVSAVDWIKKKKFEVYFLLHHPKENVYIKVATNIPRNKPEIKSLCYLWKNAEMHEREVWELFGIDFIGNKMLKSLFLEEWKEIPPFRRDFDSREYVKTVYKGK